VTAGTWARMLCPQEPQWPRKPQGPVCDGDQSRSSFVLSPPQDDQGLFCPPGLCSASVGAVLDLALCLLSNPVLCPLGITCDIISRLTPAPLPHPGEWLDGQLTPAPAVSGWLSAHSSSYRCDFAHLTSMSQSPDIQCQWNEICAEALPALLPGAGPLPTFL
jgi:hypothetical protein